MNANEEDPKSDGPSTDIGVFNRIIILLKFRLHWALYKRFPNFTSRFFDYNKVRKFHREADKEENEKTRLPNDEKIELQFLMAAELYGPGEISRLVHGINKYGWQDPDGLSPNDGAAEWLRASREVGGFGGRYSLGRIERSSNTPQSSRILKGPVPAGVEYISLYIVPITSSLTCLVATFSLEKSRTTAYANILEKDRKTRYERFAGGIQVLDVMNLKRNDIREERRRIQAIASNWFRDTIPGILVNGQLGESLATLEFLTTTEVDPLSGHVDTDSKWAECIPISSSHRAWKCDELEQLKLTWDMWPDREPGHGIAAMNISNVSSDKLPYPMFKDRFNYIYLAEENLRDLLSRHATLIVLRGFLRNLNTIRDTIREARSPSKDVIAALSRIENFFLESLGVPSILNELKDHASENGSFSRHMSSFSEVAPRRKEDKPRKLQNQMRENVEQLAGNLKEADKSARELFVQYSALISTQESVRVQRAMMKLTCAAIFLSIISLMVAVLGLR